MSEQDNNIGVEYPQPGIEKTQGSKGKLSGD